MKIPALSWFSAFVLTGAVSASALTIELDYTHDLAATDFFGTYAMAKSALEQAASDISEVLNSSLGAISSPESEGVTGTVNDTDITFDWRFTYTNSLDRRFERAHDVHFGRKYG